MSEYEEWILEITGAKKVLKSEVVQTLWSGYGELLRVTLKGGNCSSVILKRITLPDQKQHPRGWNTHFSHQRKLKSYQIEMEWYKNGASRCSSVCKVPICYETKNLTNTQLILLEDLDTIGYAKRRTSLTIDEVNVCINWLANFPVSYTHLTLPTICSV